MWKDLRVSGSGLITQDVLMHPQNDSRQSVAAETRQGLVRMRQTERKFGKGKIQK